MEFPNLGEHCEESTCKTLDFLPFKCDSCKKVFCKDHIHYSKHSCDQSSLKNKDFQVPLCPLCNQPVPYKRNEQPDIAMSAHIDRDCKSDPAEERRKVFTNRCSLKGCKQKELIPFNCHRCKRNYCIRHRHENDHNCDEIVSQDKASGVKPSQSDDIHSKRLLFFQKQQQQQEKKPTSSTSVYVNKNRPTTQPPSMSESEALEYAIKLSLMESSKGKNQSNQESKDANNKQLTEDEALARAIAESEREYNNRSSTNNTENKDSCSIQ